MPWVRAELRGQQVYARATPSGELLVEGGRVEIRYNANDGKMYRAGARNLAVSDPTPLPDDTCGPADAVGAGSKSKKSASKKTQSKKRKKANHPAPISEPSDGETIAYTDGACSGNPGPAGLGVVLLRVGSRIERYEYLGQATNNVAELTAVLRALQELAPDERAIVHTDSTYTIGVVTKGWKAKANKELVAELRTEMAKHHDVELRYVKGHAGIPLNERADELARRAVEERGSGRDADIKDDPSSAEA
jgi:ribonuclease HI